MKSIISKLSMLAVLMGLSATSNAAAVVSATGGTVNFQGSVVETSCAVDTGSETQTIDLKVVDLRDIKTPGQKSPAVPFQLKLIDCDPKIAATATFGFTGEADKTDTTALKNTDTSAEAAANVGVQMSTSGSTVVPIDGSFDASSMLTLTVGDNTADFNAYMISTAAGATAGSVHSTVDFLVQYQ